MNKKQGILSIEAALVIPPFLMAMISLMCIANVFYLNAKIEAALNEEARYLSIKNYNEAGYGTGGIEARVKNRVGNRILESGIVRLGSNGLNFSKTDLSDNEIIDICVNYDIDIPFDIFDIFDLSFEKRTLMHSFTGYGNGLSGYIDLDEYVYMTKNGKVYHRSRECSHIRLRISKVEGNSIKNLRNESGSKYKQCEYCRPKLTDENLYVTDDGDKYHNTLMCSGLKRTIRRVKLSDIGSIMPCSRCGY